MRISFTAAIVIAVLSLGACASDDVPGRFGDGGYNKRYGNHDRDHRYDRRSDRRDHQQRRHLSKRDRVYRSKNGHYYCKRSDGTIGALVGLTGDALGNAIEPGKSRKLGSILDDGGRDLARRSIDRGNVRCE